MRPTLLALLGLTACLSDPEPVPAPEDPVVYDEIELGLVPDEIAARFLHARPPLAESILVLDLRTATANERLLGASLQGLVNRDEVRIVALGTDWDPRNPGADELWLAHYEEAGLVTVEDTLDLATALELYAPAFDRFVLASPGEPWTINIATTVAAATGQLIATPSTQAQLEAAGLTLSSDLRGRWLDAVDAYSYALATYSEFLEMDAVAIQRSSVHGMRDFYIQQGIFAMDIDLDAPDADQLLSLLSTFDPQHPVFGLPGSGDPTDQWARTLAERDRYGLPSERGNNLSFHVAVGADTRRAVPAEPAADPNLCRGQSVVLAIGDGFDARTGLLSYDTTGSWNHELRAALPLGWTVGTHWAVLMPSVWDHYASTASDRSELVARLGLGSTIPSLWQDPHEYLVDSLTLNQVLGIQTTWSHDPFLTEGAPLWSALADAGVSARTGEQNVLLHRSAASGTPANFGAAGAHALPAQGTRADQNLADTLSDLSARLDDHDGSPLFFALSAWDADIGQLTAALQDLAVDNDFRVQTPSQAAACMD